MDLEIAGDTGPPGRQYRQVLFYSAYYTAFRPPEPCEPLSGLGGASSGAVRVPAVVLFFPSESHEGSMR